MAYFASRISAAHKGSSKALRQSERDVSCRYRIFIFLSVGLLGALVCYSPFRAAHFPRAERW
ncbi:MAG: hypothetical protein JNL02_16355 [Saprospiraceae bacterium]|nr:hypothetical protein [Saprospiraceae bacterium]